jgi:methyl-accepting chemotaxis protein
MVDETVKNIREGSEASESTARQLDAIVEGITKVARFLEEISNANREESQGINQITDGLDQIDQVTQSSTASAEESASAAEQLAGQAQELRGMINQFQLLENKRLESGEVPHIADRRAGGE